MRLSIKITVPILLIGLLTGALLITQILNEFENYLIQSNTHEITTNTIQTKAELQERLEDQVLFINNIIKHLNEAYDFTERLAELDSIEKQELEHELEKEQDLNSNINSIFAINLDGQTILSTNSKSYTNNYSDHDVFIKGQQQQYISSLIFDPYQEQFHQYISQPLYFDNNLTAVLVVKLNEEYLNTVIKKQNALSNKSQTYLSNKISATPNKKWFNSTEEVDSITNECLDSKSESLGVSTKQNNETSFKYALYLPELESCLITELLTDVVYGDFNQVKSTIYRNSLLGLLFCLIIVVLVVIFLIIKPISNLNTLVINYLHNNKSKINKQQGDEINNLTKNFKSLMSSLNNSENKLKKQLTINNRETETVKNILQEIGEPILVINKSLQIVRANHKFLELSGHTLDEIKGTKYILHVRIFEMIRNNKIYIDKKLIKKARETLIAQKTINETHVEFLHNNITFATISTISPLLTKRKKLSGFILLVQDISRRYQLEKSKDDFISIASHQLRTPLTAVRWYSKMLLNEKFGELSKEATEALHDIHNSIIKLIQIVNSLLNVSRIESGRLEISPKPIKISTVINELLHQSSEVIKDKMLEVNINTIKNEPEIMLDLQLTTHLYQNLLSNAIKYSNIKGSILIKIWMDDKKLHSSISDTGKGIPNESKKHVFEKFYRANNVSTNHDGTGMGLYLVKKITTEMNGEISFTSEVDKGSTFEINWPITGVEKQEGESHLQLDIE